MKQIVAAFLFASALVLATYGITRHEVAIRIQKQNEAAFLEYAQAEAQLQEQDLISQGVDATGWKFPSHVRTLQLRLGMPDGVYTFQVGMIVCLAGAAVLTAVALFICQRKRNLEPPLRLTRGG